jgi:monothiol glutaredoxin
MTRSLLDPARIHPAIGQMVAASHADIVAEATAAIAANAIVIIGMAQNPFVRKARKMLDGFGTPYHYLEYGSYFSGWRRRTALKMWSGWSTFPMVFVQGVLVGGASQLQSLIDSGELARMLADPRS